jgi:hypothetical protein
MLLMQVCDPAGMRISHSKTSLYPSGSGSDEISVACLGCRFNASANLFGLAGENPLTGKTGPWARRFWALD